MLKIKVGYATTDLYEHVSTSRGFTVVVVLPYAKIEMIYFRRLRANKFDLIPLSDMFVILLDGATPTTLHKYIIMTVL